MRINKKAFNFALAQTALTKREVSKKSGVSASTITKAYHGTGFEAWKERGSVEERLVEQYL